MKAIFFILTLLLTRDHCFSQIDESSFLYIPNSFSPNNDGVNDVFLIVGNGIIEYKCTIYNRWNQLIFESNDLNIFWTGDEIESSKPDPMGFYLYLITAKGDDGKEFNLFGMVKIYQ